MHLLSARFLGTIVATVLVLGILAGCGITAEGDAPQPDPEPVTKAPEPAGDTGAAGRPTIAEAEAAVLALAREEYASIPIESATVYAMGRDSAGTWWVQAWTTASPEFEGEPGEQWFVTWDGESWELVTYGTGLGTDEFPDVVEWEQLQ